ncbi:MAG TPA: GNAT family N-acetyltransferase [Terracidiphilus sp.]|nr:GNAT family N-acetyltransferase [Terracidiphilus sp.]
MLIEGHTSRLLLRPLCIDDADQIQAEFPRWEIVRYLLNRVPWPYPPDGALMFIRDRALPAMAREEAWHWTLRLKTAPEQVIGLISLTREEDNHRGFWLNPALQGQGLMTEACVWVNDYWFETLGMPVMRVGKASANEASRRISKKHGMRKIGEKENDYVSGKLMTELWEFTADEWRTWKNAHQNS